MGCSGETAAAARRSQAGYTLVELLVASTVAMVVLGGAVTVFIGAVRSEPRTSSKVSAIRQGRVAVERISRELRQGSDVTSASAAGLTLIAYLPEGSCGGSAEEGAEQCRITYACESSECTRAVAAPDGSSEGVAAQVVDELTSTEVFSYSPPLEAEAEPEPEYVGVEFSFETTEGGPVVVSDGATLRNAGA
jgi:type II secretory pathway pseudopilin PulG